MRVSVMLLNGTLYVNLSVAVGFMCIVKSDVSHISKYDYTSLDNRVIINLERLPEHS